VKDIECTMLSAPFLEASSLLDERGRDTRLETLARFIDIADAFELEINLETDLPPLRYRGVLQDMPTLGVCYDSGNSNHFGYKVVEEWRAYGERIRSVYSGFGRRWY
jgi:hypothetical protein